ncbi:hypothetical protein QZM42_33535 [Burkholderia vietnamiensis]|uniref:hypothetical protein n=1 Tax=Burkholderia vietnamiensis TaxID=60552 RepID=UPI002653D7CD|nr:hypothetical protein [Burkholderia vietnamiensis]MDN7413450.1 hypothetical protein [Burkholderia vietnamiensis]
MDEREILRIAVRHDIDSYLTEALTLEFVRDVLKAARRTTTDRKVIVEEIAEMVDHMGEGRRLEEYVGAIREMRGGNR